LTFFKEKIRLRRANYVNAIIFDDTNRHVLLVKNGTLESHYWSFPGGGVEGAETLEQALVREVREETGLTIAIGRLYSVREVLFRQRDEHALIFTFTATILDGELRISDPDHEILEVRWVDLHTANQWMPYIPTHLHIPEDRKIYGAYYYFHGYA
jgi:8-oxo-dGTP diphosphatase